jgi:hypothetical protein
MLIIIMFTSGREYEFISKKCVEGDFNDHLLTHLMVSYLLQMFLFLEFFSDGKGDMYG